MRRVLASPGPVDPTHRRAPLWEYNPNAEPAAQRLKPDATAHGTAKVPRAATDAPALNRAQTAFLRSPTHVKGVH